MNAWLKRLVNTRTRLSLLFKVATIDVVAANKTKAIVAELKAQQNARRVTLSESAVLLVKEATRLLRHYPRSLFNEQFRRCKDYNVAIIDANAIPAEVRHKVAPSLNFAVFNPPSCMFVRIL